MTPSTPPAAPGAPARVLAVTAHPDDAEYFFGGTLALWSAAGSRVTLAVATDGERGRLPTGVVASSLAAMRREEQRRAAACLGVGEITFLGFPDAVLEESLELRRAISALIRRTRAELVISLDPTAWFLDGRVNHPDHRALGAAAVAACWPAAGSPLSFPELAADGLAAHQPRALWLAATHEPNHSVDITAAFAQKVAALACNASQIDGDEATRTAVVRTQLHAAFGHEREDGATVYVEHFRTLAL